MLISPPKIIRAFFPSLVWRKENTKNKIWLTFDDGPHPIVTPFILQILKEENVKATFFLIGKEIKKYPNIFQNIINEGHLVANHSYSHKNGWLTSNKAYLKDIEKCQKIMPKNKIFRPPYGKISPFQIRKLKKIYQIILWDILTCDYSKHITANKIKQNVLLNIQSGSIIVFHNNAKSYNHLKKILQETIQEIKKNGFVFSTTW